MAFSAADVKKLREMTGVGMMDCKKALTASDGDMDKAVEWLREKGLAASQKKAGRIAAEGVMDFPLNQKTVSRAKQLMVITKKDGICGYEKNGGFSTSKKDGWEMFDAGIATQTFCLAAHAKGVGTVILGVFDDAKVGEIVGIPEGQTVAAVVAMGYPAFAPDMPPRKSVDDLLTLK